MIGFTYAQLLQALQDWPVNQGTNYVGNIPRFVELGELRLVRDLNLDIFDVIDSSFALNTAANIVTKPTPLITLRTMRVAPITGTTTQPANPSAVCAAQGTTQAVSALVLTASPFVPAIAAQATITEVAEGQGGILVTIVGLDDSGSERIEQLASEVDTVVTGLIRWSEIDSVTVSNGSPLQTIEIGTAEVAATTLGRSSPVYKRSWDYVNNFAADPAVTGRPRYYAEVDSATWQVAPASDANYQVVVRFVARPETIVTAGTSWLGTNCGDLLFLTSLMEAEEYLKADDRFADLEAEYNAKLGVARVELRNIIRQGDYTPVKPAAAPVQGG